MSNMRYQIFRCPVFTAGITSIIGNGENIWGWDREPGLSLENRRYGNIADVAQYCERLKCRASVIDEEEVISGDESANEMIMLACRTRCRGRYRQVSSSCTAQTRGSRLEQAAEPLVRSGLMSNQEETAAHARRFFSGQRGAEKADFVDFCLHLLR